MYFVFFNVCRLLSIFRQCCQEVVFETLADFFNNGVNKGSSNVGCHLHMVQNMPTTPSKRDAQQYNHAKCLF